MRFQMHVSQQPNIQIHSELNVEAHKPHDHLVSMFLYENNCAFEFRVAF